VRPAGSSAVPTAAVEGAAVAIVSGSGLAVVPEGMTVEAVIEYGRLGWPVTDVPGHPSRLLVARTALGVRVLLACGRPHLYEGWSGEERSRAIDDLAAWGVGRFVLTNASGSLAPDLEPGALVVVDEIVDLQSAPDDRPPRLPATPSRIAEAAMRALADHASVRRGRYVAVAGPQYETPAEAAWLAGLGDVVGMSTAAEQRAALTHGAETCVVSCAVNRAGAAVSHADVLAAGSAVTAALAPGLAALVRACWPEIFV
jgi:purine-nucleoside phosphorylase